MNSSESTPPLAEQPHQADRGMAAPDEVAARVAAGAETPPPAVGRETGPAEFVATEVAAVDNAAAAAVDAIDAIDDGAPAVALPPAVSTAGQVLAAARQARGLSVEDVSRQLKFSVAQVHALEGGDYASLPSPVIARGFMRSYARFVGADIDALLPTKPVPAATVQVERMMRKQPGAVVPAQPQRSMAWGFALVACLAGSLALYEFVWNVPPKTAPVESTPPPAPASAAAPDNAPAEVANGGASGTDAAGGSVNGATAAGTVGEGAIAANPAADPAAAGRNEGAPAADTASTPANAPAASSVPAAVTASATSSAGAASAERELQFRFKGDAWVEVRDGDDALIHRKRNAAGTELRVKGRPPFRVVVGAASGVQLRDNGKPVNLTDYVKSGDVARLTLE